ncbi:MAG TPA: 1-acyl-sn-glycerol-3-phosphate acyltransferase [Thermoanaerobaculia bacterium]
MVSLPLWLAVVLFLLAAWAALDRLLVPGVRWYLRRRVQRVIDELNTRLRLEIPQFQRTRRQVLVDRLVYDPKVVQAVDEQAREQGTPRAVLAARVRRYAREIVPAFNAYFYFRIGYWLSKRVARSLYRVRLGFSDEAGLAAVAPGSTVVFLMNHRSNMDYILVAYLAADQTALSYAVGEWARIWPLQTLIRSTGAYFVRRNSGDPLYRRVLERYIYMATSAGVPQAVYPEGGLTRDGRLRPPKLGILDYMLRSFDPRLGERDLVFIPVGINYDRVLEDRTLLLDLEPERQRRGPLFAAATTLRFAWRNLSLMLRSRWHRFGYACVNFGSPLSMRRYLGERGLDLRPLAREERTPHLERLGAELMAAIGSVIPVLPVPLVAAVLVQAGEPLSELELKSRAYRLMTELAAAGAHVYIPRQDQDYAIAAGLRMLTLRHLVEERDGLYAAQPEERTLLSYYANSIAHLAVRIGASAPLAPAAEPPRISRR